MKSIEKEIHWCITDEEHENGHITFGTKACGKATIVLPEGFVVPSEYTNCLENKFDFFTDEKLSDEQILSKYLSNKWDKIIENYYINNPAIISSLLKLHSDVLVACLVKMINFCLNKMAETQNIGEIKNLTVEYLTNKDEDIETIKVKDKTYKIATTKIAEYNLIQDQSENEIKGQTKSTEDEQK